MKLLRFIKFAIALTVLMPILLPGVVAVWAGWIYKSYWWLIEQLFDLLEKNRYTNRITETLANWLDGK